MKRIITIITITVTAFTMNVSAQMVQDQVSMGFGYANDVFYSLENGEVGQAGRSNWDIAFYTNAFSSAVITNGAEGVDLYCYPNGDTTAWNSIDTTGLFSTWTVLYNDEYEWENGAFNRHALGHPDYGWGYYNPINHDVIGDSIYILKLTDGSFKKLWIKRKNSVNNVYEFLYADLDGSNEVTESVSATSFVAKNFIYYSMVNGEVLDREPPADSWDIVFTQYMASQSVGGYYPVTGVLNNVSISGNKFTQVGPDFDDWGSQPMDTSKATIGYDWKYFDMGTFSYIIIDSVAFFVKDLGGDVYKLVFTGFDGMSTGNIEFEKMMVSSLSVDDPVAEKGVLSVGPNPASSTLNINLPAEVKGSGSLVLFDLSGKRVISMELENNFSPVYQVNIGQVQDGMYILALTSGEKSWTTKVIIRK